MRLQFATLTPEVRAIQRTLQYAEIECEDEVSQNDDGVTLHLDDVAIVGWLAVFVYVSRLARTLPNHDSLDHALTMRWLSAEVIDATFDLLEADLRSSHKLKQADDGLESDDPSTPAIWLCDFDATSAADILWMERLRVRQSDTELSPLQIRYMQQDVVAASGSDSVSSLSDDDEQASPPRMTYCVLM